MDRFEYKVLATRGELRAAWFDGSRRLGTWDELEAILNRYAAEGWRLVAHAMGIGMSRVILERPRQPREALPADAPEGRGDELAAGLAAFPIVLRVRRRRRRSG
jgi:hypothetical protein